MPTPAPPSARPTAAGRYGSRRGSSSSVKPMSPSAISSRAAPGSTGTPTSADSRSVNPGSCAPPPVTTIRRQRRRTRLIAVVVDRAADLVEQDRQRALDRRAGRGRRARRGRSPSWRFNASAVSGGRSRSVAIASVSSRPPVPSTRTKRGTPPSCTAIAVTPPPNETMPSAPGRLPERDAAAVLGRARVSSDAGADECEIVCSPR